MTLHVTALLFDPEHNNDNKVAFRSMGGLSLSRDPIHFLYFLLL